CLQTLCAAVRAAVLGARAHLPPAPDTAAQATRPPDPDHQGHADITQPLPPAVSDWVEHSPLKCVCLLDAGKVRFVHFVHFPTVVSLPLSFRAAQTARNLTNIRLPVTFSEVPRIRSG